MLFTNHKSELRHSRLYVRTHAGFSLIELLVYMAVVSVMLTAAVSLYAEFVQASSKVASLREVNRNARLAVARMVVETREASGVNSMSCSPTCTISLASTDARNPTVFSVVNESGGNYLAIQQAGGAVIRLTSNKVNVDEFTLTNLSNGPVTRVIAIHLKVSYRTNVTLFNASTVIDTTAQVKALDGFQN